MRGNSIPLEYQLCFSISDRQTRSLLQRSGLRNLYSTAIAETRKINPALVWSKNIHKPMWFESLFDYEFAELDPEDGIEPATFLRLRKRQDKPDRTQIYTLRSGNVRQNQATIALAYATGSLVSAPYDVYPADGYLTRQRFYGKVFHYAPLYAMVRYCAPLLNGYEDAYFECEGAEDERWESPPLQIEGKQDGEIAIFVRAPAGAPKKGLTLHLLDRTNNEVCSGMSVKLRRDVLQPLGEAFDVIWHAPLEYNKQSHEHVESRVLEIGRVKKKIDAIETSPEYRDLVKRTKLDYVESDEFISFHVPDFAVYAIVQIGARED